MSLSVQVQAFGNFAAIGGLDKLSEGGYVKFWNQAGKRVAENLQVKVLELYRTGVSGHKEIHWFTQLTRTGGGGPPLYDTGTMAESVQIFAVKVGKLLHFAVGFEPGELGDRAGRFEVGTQIRVTDKMRAYLHSVGFHLRDSTTVLVIPPRPVFLPAWLASKNENERILAEELDRAFSEQNLTALGKGSFWDRLKARLSRRR